jgi:hypothetical protein
MNKKRKIVKMNRVDMENRLQWYFHRRWNTIYKKFYIIPSISWTWSASGDFIEQGVYAPMFIIKLEWLHFEAGVYTYHEMH